jgi:hypothetical protein
MCRQDPFCHGPLKGVDTFAGDARNFEESQAPLARELFERGDALRVLRRVELGGSPGSSACGPALQRSWQARSSRLQQPRALDVPQELHAQAVAFVRAFDQAGDISHHEGTILVGG